MASNIPVIVQGNSFSLAIPLQIYYINGDQMDLEDYTPDPTDEVSVQLKGSRRNYTYTPTIDGNVANIDLTGNELADNYGVVVSVVKANGQRLRSFRTDQFFIVESSDDLTPADIIEGLEENVIYLNSSIFVAGEDGRGIEGIVKTSTAGLVDTYTITYTDATTSTFNVTNGANGAQGAQGADGVGITSIDKTSTSGLVDTYTITMSNGTTTTFDVTNGKDGYDLGLAAIINNTTTGGTTDALSAEMGKELAGNEDVTKEATQSLAVASGGQDVYYPLSLKKDVTYTITLDISVEDASDLPTGYLILKGFYNGSATNLTSQLWWKGTGKPTVFTQTIELTPTSDYSLLDLYQRTVVTACTVKVTINYVHNKGVDYVKKSVGKNLCNPAEINPNHCVYQQVTSQPPYIRSNPSNNVTGYIPIKAGQTLVCNKVANSNGYNKCALFASPEDDCVIDGTYTSGDTSLGYQVITNNLGYDAYAVFTIVSTATDVQVEVGTAPTEYEPYSPIGGYVSGVYDMQKQVNIVQSLIAPVKGINHRGYNLLAPENTMPAFIMSVKNGFAYVETDIQFTSDAVAVLLHDTSINRTARNADGTAISGTVNIADITYEQALEYDFGIWKGSAYAGTKIPRLIDFLAFCRAVGAHPYLELKSTLTQAEVQNVVAIVNGNGMRGRITYIANNAGKLGDVKNVDSKARLGLVCSTVDATVISQAEGLQTANNEVFVDTSDTSTNAVTLCKNAGIPLERWTIDTEAGILALDPYITGVTSDNLVASSVLYESVEL